MSSAYRIARAYAETQGWSDSALLSVVLSYVANQMDDERFREYLEETVEYNEGYGEDE